jgi:RHS repeat-associated protein
VYDVNGSLPVILTDGTFKYVYGIGLTYCVDTSGNVQVYHTDGLGSVRAITDASGDVTQTYQEDEFGVPVQTHGTSSQPFQYTGQRRDAETGLYDLRARMYDPTIGRFFSRDPLAGLAAAPQTLNRFTYVENNPVRSVDPSGMKAQALGPGFCFDQTIFGGFIFTSIFCASTQMPQSQTKAHAPAPGCPYRDPNPSREVWPGRKPGFGQGRLVTATRGPEGGPNNCHVNAQGLSDAFRLNFHIYYDPTAQVPYFYDPMIGILGTDISQVASDVARRLAAGLSAASKGLYRQGTIASWYLQEGILEERLENLVELYSGSAPP